MNVTIHNKEYTGVHPHKFLLWCAIAGMIMMFAALTSAYIVRKSAGNWLEFQLPSIFWINTAVILLSSLTIHFSYKSYLKGNKALYQGLMLTTFVLGIAFLVLQYKGWLTLTDMEIYLNTNPSASFIYVISGIHAAHLLGGITALCVALAFAFKLSFKVTKRRAERFELICTYWHFVDILWIYLMIFFIVQ